MTPTLHITRGLPASGKTTEALKWLQESPESRRRVNRDDLRFALFGRYWGGIDEVYITKVQRQAIGDSLSHGFDVIVDDTNLNAKNVKELLKLAAKHRAEVEWHDEFLDVPLTELLERDAVRDKPVGRDVIINFHSRYMQGGKRPKRPELAVDEVSVHARYEGTPGAPKTVLVDLDGTVALNGLSRDQPNRGWFDWHRVGEDLPNQPVIDLVFALSEGGYTILFVSGRTDEPPCRELTEAWLTKHFGWTNISLIMRETDCGRKDSIVKLELFDKYIRNNYDVQFCIDDRNQVVQAYRSIGLTVLQVADGDF